MSSMLIKDTIKVGKSVKKIKSLHKRLKYKKILSILSQREKPNTEKAEIDFYKLQHSYSESLKYGYDPLSLYKRASQRILELLKLPTMAFPGHKLLELGSGDGMLGLLLNCFGHHIILSDIADWRVPQAKILSFIQADYSYDLPTKSNHFDLAFSYNSFEHFPDPRSVFLEIIRIIKPGGLIFLSFGPLYCSPWGLHAYRTLRMPYPQFLFSEEFTSKKLEDLGIYDLGSKRDVLQYLNKWKPDDYDTLWKSPYVEKLFIREWKEYSFLNVITAYPESFEGRGLCLRDVTQSGYTIALKKV